MHKQSNEFGSPARRQFSLQRGVTFLNHGSFGAPPRRVQREAERWRRRMEANPDRFLRETLPPALRAAADRLARAFGAAPGQLGFVENATAGANAVLRSVDFRRGDEILLTSHTYGAVRQATQYVCSRIGARIVVSPIPLPVSGVEDMVAPIAERLSGRTRLVVLDHIASPTGLIFPVERLARLARRRGAKVLVDGAHAPGQIPLDIPALAADWYIGNCHKWLFAPRGCAFLWARAGDVHPLSISHGYGKGFTAEFDWTGTRDFSPWLAVTAALDFSRGLGPAAARYRQQLVAAGARRMAAAWDQPLDGPAELHASMAAVRVPSRDPQLRSRLLHKHRIVAAIMDIDGAAWCRVSAQIYNTPADFERLVAAVLDETSPRSRRSRR